MTATFLGFLLLMAGGVFRFDPAPQQAASHAPIPAQGQQPPKFSFVKSMAAILAWPTGMEPGLPQPDFHRARIAPLTLVYGDQPPFATGQRDLDLFYETVTQAWQPAAPLPQQVQEGTAAWNVPIIVTAQPAFTRFPLSVVTAWQADYQPRQTKNPIAPLTLQYGQQPPPYSIVNQTVVVASWKPPDPQPQRDRGYVAPLTLQYGSQPPIVSARIDALIRSWQPIDTLPVIPPKSAAWNFVLLAQPPYTSQPWTILQSWQQSYSIVCRANSIAPFITVETVPAPPSLRHLVPPYTSLVHSITGPGPFTASAHQTTPPSQKWSAATLKPLAARYSTKAHRITARGPYSTTAIRPVRKSPWSQP